MKRRSGFALITALWMVVVLTALSVEIATLARTRRLGAANAVETQAGRAAADAGIEHARARLTRRQSQLSDLASGGSAAQDPWWRVELVMPDTFSMGDERYTVRLRDAGARVNVNRASEDDLRRLFTALRIDVGKADQLAQSIADWRDGDDRKHLRGAEQKEYLAAGLRALPRNAPLVRVEELRDLYDMTPQLYATIAPHLTVYGSGQININTAGRAELLALPGFTDETVAAVERLRASGVQLSSLDQLALALGSGTRNLMNDSIGELLPRVTFETREVEVVSEGWMVNSPVRARTTGLLVRGGGAVFFIGKRAE
jgi:general secretion pathway protein K